MVSQRPTVLRRYISQGNPRLVHPPVELVAILECYCGQPDALITVLEEPQEHYGYHPIQARIGQCVPPGTVFLSFHCKEAPAHPGLCPRPTGGDP